MKILHRRFVAAVIVMLALLLTPANIFSCGPFFSEPVFTEREGPDQPLALFVQGRLGIVLPSYDRQYLVVAYRYLAGPPLSKAEQDTLAQAWAPKVTAPGQPSPDEIPVTKWQEARTAALGLSQVVNQDINRFRWLSNGWQQYPNCGDDAFLNAAQTAAGLTKKYGAGSPQVRDWVQAQDMVFENCGPTAGTQVTPQGATQLQSHIPQAATLQNAVL